MTGKCSQVECAAPINCHLGNDSCAECPNFTPDSEKKVVKKEKAAAVRKDALSWDGEALSPLKAVQVSVRNSPIVIGIIGKADAGKTSFLAMFYTLLLNGKRLNGYTFAGTKTILGWDELYHRLKLTNGGVSFPQPTPVNANRLYHLALRDSAQRLKDVLLSDVSGEAFSLWSVNRSDDNAGNARWVYSNANAFMLFIDCDALVTNLNAAKMDIMLIARQMTHDLRNRPVIAIWSKSDKKDQILSGIRESLHTELPKLFPNYHEIDISNFLEPGPDTLVHDNNLKAFNWLLDKIEQPTAPPLALDEIPSQDLFINYKGK